MLTTGTFVFISMNSTVSVSDSTFYDGISYLGGAIYILGEASVSISNTDLYSNYAYLYGGAIYASKFASVTLNGKTSLYNNKALERGDDIYAI